MQAAPAVVMARPQFSAAAPVMMAKKEDSQSIVDKLFNGPKARFAGGLELLSGQGRGVNGKNVQVDGSAYACQGVENTA